MTLSELNAYIIATLEEGLGRREATATARLLLEDILDVDPTKLLTRGERTIEPETEEKFRSIVSRIAEGEPPQYVVGHARFMGMDFKVSPATLIPRPETAELVDLVTDYVRYRPEKYGLHILDIGTGSGCIAISLARALSFADITGIDISEDALAVAHENAATLHAKVDFIKLDFLDNQSRNLLSGETFDIIVANPPYIAENERDTMEKRVKDHEPPLALFVPDNDPLVFYRTIVDYALNEQKSERDCALFFEINPLYVADLRKMLSSRGLDCDIIRDSFGKERFCKSIVKHGI